MGKTFIRLVTSFAIAASTLFAPAVGRSSSDEPIQKKAQTNNIQSRHADQTVRQYTMAYIDSHMEDIVKTWEKETGLELPGMPKVEYGPRCGITNSGCYDTEKDIIYLLQSDPLLNWGFSWVSDTKSVAEKVLSKFVDLSREVMYHELGHFYMDKLNESRGKGNWPPLGEPAEMHGQKLISEGTAECLGNMAGNRENSYDYHYYPEKIDEWETMDIYTGGCYLVLPIIKKYGQKGIEYLMDNPPKDKDFDFIMGYRLEVLQQLLKLSKD